MRRKKAVAVADDDDDDAEQRGSGVSRTPKGKQKSRPGKLGFEGVDDDGSAQSRYKGLSSGARAALRKKREMKAERTSGEVEPAFELPPPAPVGYVDCLFFASEIASRKDAVLEAAKAAKDTDKGPSGSILYRRELCTLGRRPM